MSNGNQFRTLAGRNYQFRPVHSQEDGGWYVEVCELPSYREVHITGVYNACGAALGAAQRWCEKRDEKRKHRKRGGLWKL